MLYGTEIQSDYRPLRDVLVYPELTTSGNLIAAVGREVETPGGPYEKIAHVVMKRDEAISYARQILDLYGVEIPASEERAEAAEYVDVLTYGGVVTVDVEASIAGGQLDEGDCETTSEVLAAVRAAISAGQPLDTPEGGRTIVSSRAVLATTYRRA